MKALIIQLLIALIIQLLIALIIQLSNDLQL
jgi:hypothetical protein